MAEYETFPDLTGKRPQRCELGETLSGDEVATPGGEIEGVLSKRGGEREGVTFTRRIKWPTDPPGQGIGPPRLYRVIPLEAWDGPVPPPWYECREPFQWGLSDDGYVGQLIRCDPLQKALRQTWSYARVMVYQRPDGERPVQRLLFEERFRKEGGMYKHRPQPWADQEARRTRFKRAIALYARLLLSGRGQISLAEERMVASIWRPDEENPLYSWRRLLKQTPMIEALMEQLSKLLSQQEITRERVLEMYMRSYELAHQVGQPLAMIKVADTFAAMLGMNTEGGTAMEAEWQLDTSALDEPLYERPALEQSGS